MHNIIKKKAEKIKIEKIDIIIFATIIIIFGIALLSFYPAILTSDGVDQMRQAMTNKYNGGHPVFHTLILGNISKIFGTVSAAAFFQIIIFALIWTSACKNLRKDNNSFKNKVFQYVATLIISCIPLNFMYSITLWKDILYSYLFLAMIICIYKFIINNFKFSVLDIILLCISIVCVMRFRYNGPGVGIIMFLVILLLNLIKQKNIKYSAIFCGLFIILYFVTGIPQNTLIVSNNTQKDSAETKGTSIYSKFNGTLLHATGAILNSDVQIENEDIEFLNKILDVEEWKKSYCPYTAAKIHYNKNIKLSAIGDKEKNDKFGNIFIKYAKQNPMIIIKHFAKVNTIDWSIKEYYPLNSVVMENDWIREISNGKYETTPKLKNMHKLLYKYTLFTLNNKILYKIIYRPATVMYISIIMMIIILIKTKKIKYILLILPMIINIGTYVFLITSQDQRYFYPNYMTFYFLTLVCFNIFARNKYIAKKKTEQKSYSKKLIIIPLNKKNKKLDIKNINLKNENIDILVIGKEFNSNYKNVKYLKLVADLSYDKMLECGFKYSKENNYDIVVEIGEICEENKIVELINGISKEKYDIVILKNEKEKLKNKLNEMYIRFQTNKEISNSLSKCRAFNKKIINEFSSDYEKINSLKNAILEKSEIKEIL